MHKNFVKDFYERHLSMQGSRLSGEQLHTICPCHDDSTPSFNANMVTGAYHCFNADCELHPGGGMAKFLSIVEKIPLQEAENRIANEHANEYPEEKKSKKKRKEDKKFPYTPEEIIERVTCLLNTPDKLQWIKQNCLWTEETIQKFEIGYDAAEGLFWIPVKEDGVFKNIKKYNPKSDTNKYLSLKDFGTNTIFLSGNLIHQEIYLMEGEKDCILANQLGLNAVSFTGGAGSFNNEWKPLFAQKDIVICYDIDAPGKAGAIKVGAALAMVARRVKNVALDITSPPNGDFTDYIKSGKTLQDFMALVNSATIIKQPSAAPVDIPDEVVETTLDNIDASKLFYHRVRMNVRVIAKDTSPFLAMQDVTVDCFRDNGRNCDTCRVAEKNNTATAHIDETTPRLLDLIECTTQDKIALIRDIFYIPPCRKFTVKETGHQAIHKVAVIPSIDEIKYDDDSFNQRYVERELYFIGDNLEANNDYQIEALAVPSPKDQSLVLIGYKVQPADSSIEEFKMTPELKKELEIFQCKSETK